MPTNRGLACGLGSIFVMAIFGCGQQADIDRTTAQVARLVEDLDRRTTETGAYVRVKDGDIKDRDAWGTPIQVFYAQGGLAETVTVRSAGPDREFHTTDDIQGTGVSANLTGVGNGIKKNVEDVAANTAKGLVKGTVSGVKESIKETFSRGNRQAAEAK